MACNPQTEKQTRVLVFGATRETRRRTSFRYYQIALVRRLVYKYSGLNYNLQLSIIRSNGTFS
jgi:hypothetical protein